MTTMKGLFKPKNPGKYRGNPTNIIYRSQWEFKVMMQLDHDPNVVEWSSEELPIAYQDPTQNRYARYFPDFMVKYNNGQKLIIEVKPKMQTVPPRDNGNKKRFIKETFVYMKNQAKWQAARKYCEHRGYEFVIMTEDEIFGRKTK